MEDAEELSHFFLQTNKWLQSENNDILGYIYKQMTLFLLGQSERDCCPTVKNQ